MRLTGSVVQPMRYYDLLSYKAIGSNYLSFVVTSMLVSTSPLDEAGTATVRYASNFVKKYGTLVRYVFFVIVRVQYVGTVRFFCKGTAGTVRSLN